VTKPSCRPPSNLFLLRSRPAKIYFCYDATVKGKPRFSISSLQRRGAIAIAVTVGWLVKRRRRKQAAGGVPSAPERRWVVVVGVNLFRACSRGRAHQPGMGSNPVHALFTWPPHRPGPTTAPSTATSSAASLSLFFSLSF
jgi:hypothetical protein